MAPDIQGIIDRLKLSIEKSKLSYVELEKKTGIAKSSIQRYANGTTKKIPIDAIQAIAKACGVTPTPEPHRTFIPRYQTAAARSSPRG